MPIISRNLGPWKIKIKSNHHSMKQTYDKKSMLCMLKICNGSVKLFRIAGTGVEWHHNVFAPARESRWYGFRQWTRLGPFFALSFQKSLKMTVVLLQKNFYFLPTVDRITLYRLIVRCLYAVRIE